MSAGGLPVKLFSAEGHPEGTHMNPAGRQALARGLPQRNRHHPLALVSLGEMEREPIAVVETCV